MNKHMRLIPALMLGMAMLSIPTLASAEVTADIVSASLLAKGAGVRVTVAVSCDAPLPEDSVIVEVEAQVTQRVNKFIVQGREDAGGGEPIICNNTPQTFDVIVSSFEFNLAFKKGMALVDAFAQVIDPNTGLIESDNTTEEIRIK